MVNPWEPRARRQVALQSEEAQVEVRGAQEGSCRPEESNAQAFEGARVKGRPPEEAGCMWSSSLGAGDLCQAQQGEGPARPAGLKGEVGGC